MPTIPDPYSSGPTLQSGWVSMRKAEPAAQSAAPPLDVNRHIGALADDYEALGIFDSTGPVGRELRRRQATRAEIAALLAWPAAAA